MSVTSDYHIASWCKRVRQRIVKFGCLIVASAGDQNMSVDQSRGCMPGSRLDHLRAFHPFSSLRIVEFASLDRRAPGVGTATGDYNCAVRQERCGMKAAIVTQFAGSTEF